MVKFTLTMGALKVLVNGKPFGYIQKGDGFFTSPCSIREHTKASPTDLRKIADKAERAMKNKTLSPS